MKREATIFTFTKVRYTYMYLLPNTANVAFYTLSHTLEESQGHRHTLPLTPKIYIYKLAGKS